MYIFEASDLFVLFTSLGLNFYFECVLLFENAVNLNCPSLLGQWLFVHFYPFLELFIFIFQLFSLSICLRHHWKGWLRFICFFQP